MSKGNPAYLNQLGLCMRAGKLVTGEEMVIEAVRDRTAKLVILTKDASANTAKKVTDKCNSFGVPLRVAGTRTEIGAAIGKGERVVVAVTDAGLAGLVQSGLEKTEVNGIE